MGRALVPGGGCDLVSTPRGLADRIVWHFKPSGKMLDPCCGMEQTPFYDALCNYGGSPNDVNWCEVRAGLDFFDWSYRGIDWIVTNPPWSQFRRFLQHAMTVSENVVFLAPLPHFLTRARLRDVEGSGFGLREALLLDSPRPPWPQSGLQLAAVHLCRGPLGPVRLVR